MTNKTNLFEITNFTIGDFFFEKKLLENLVGSEKSSIFAV